jgi:hypothetical protein
VAVLPSPRALITVADARALGIEGATDTIQRFINQASELAHTYAQREFVWRGAAFEGGSTPVEQEAEERIFDFWGLPKRVVDIGDAAEVISVTVNGAEVVEGDWLPLPRQREPWQPFTQVRFLPTTFSWATSPRSWATVGVTAQWGFPVVPEQIQRAVAVTVEAWFQRDIQLTSSSYDQEAGGLGGVASVVQDRTWAMPWQARQLLDQFRAVTV